MYIVCKTVITVEFPNAKNRRKQIKVHLNLSVEKMGHLYRVIKQHVIDIKCRNSLPLCTQDNYKHNNMGSKTAMRCTRGNHMSFYYITNLVCYTYFHWFFNPECQHIFGKQTRYIFQSSKTIKTWTTKH